MEVFKGPNIFTFVFEFPNYDPMFRSRQFIVDRWLSACGKSSDQMGMVLAIPSKVVRVSWEFWQPQSKYSQFRFHYNKEFSFFVDSDANTRTGMFIPKKIKEYKEGGQFSCFFEGGAYNPQVTLYFETLNSLPAPK